MTDYGLERSAEIMSRAFEDYFVRIPFPVTTLLKLARTDSVDLASSRVFLRDGVAIGGALIARRGWTSRLAAMAIVPEARRAGFGRAAVLHLLAEAKASGGRTMVLEVIEQNTAALELYRTCGFKEIRRLIGFAGPPVAASAIPSGTFALSDLVEVDLREVAAAVSHYGLPDLPWQLSGETLAQLAPPAVGYRLNGAWLAISDPADAVVNIHAVIAEPAAQGLGHEAALLRAAMAKHPRANEWRLSPKWPEEWAPLLESAGLPRMPLTQWQMHRKVQGVSSDLTD
jgi:ribosomal protein S18 acetylase RimI-like enzyme